MKSVALRNLGCKVNSYELDVMQQMLQEKGYIIVPFDTEADIYIVNTCTVTNIADRKSRQMLHQAKARNPKAIVVAVGCYVQTGTGEALADECVDLAIGNNKKKEMVEILEAFLEEKEKQEGKQTGESPAPSGQPAGALGSTAGNSRKNLKTLNDTSVIDVNADCGYEEMTLKHTAEHTRAYIKIQDGCNQFCSYCIIPFARGRVRSRKWEDIYAEVKGLAEAGYREIVLTGIHISSYGIDFEDEAWEAGRSVVQARETGQRDYRGSSKLLDLLERIQHIEGIARIRLGSLEPRIITEQSAKRLADMPKVCPHFHLSLQSGCDATLKRMNRHYTAGEYLKCVERLRAVYENPAVTTDVIVGFPGETEEEFLETYAFLEKVSLYEMHIFKYSKRKGTRAAVMPGQVPGPVQTSRSNKLIELEKKQSRAFREAYIGRETEVLFEDTREIAGRSYMLGHTAEYLRVAKQTEENLSNCLMKGKITGFLNDELLLME